MGKVLLGILLTAISLKADSQLSLSDSTNQSGKVYFMRSTGYMGSAQGFTVFIDDSMVCKLNNKRFSIHNIPPGKHTFSVQFAGKISKEKSEKIEINIEMGRTYYIQLLFQSGFFANNIYCQEVTESSAKTIIGKLAEDNKCL